MVSFTRIALSVLLLAACTWRATALDPDRKLSQYVRERWGNDKGLSGEVEAITQTPDGYLWIGTTTGLFRFDGTNFTPVLDEGASHVPLVNVLGLMVDNRGSLIARLPERNLLRYANGGFENILYPLRQRELAITAMCRATDGGLLVAGIVNGLMTYRNGHFENIAPSSSLPSSPVISVAQSADGKIWLGTRAGLFYLKDKRAIAVNGEFPSRTINSLLTDGPDLWIGTDSGLVRWNGTGTTTEGVPSELRGVRVLALLRDRDSNLWVGTGSGLYRVNSGGASQSAESKSAAGAAVATMFEDSEGDLWAGGPLGVECWRDGGFTTYGKREGLPSDSNGPIHADSDGRIWFAPQSGGLEWLDRGETKRITIAGLDQDVVYSIAGTNRDIWLGRQEGGLTHLFLRNGEMSSETFTDAQGLAQNSVYSVYQSRDGSVWAGTLSRGVSRFVDGHFTNYSESSGLAANSVASILQSADGTMWFATANGLRAFANGKWRGYTTKDGLPSDDVSCLTEDSRGILWIGTAAGLAFLSTSGITTPQNVPAVLREPIFGLAEDSSGGLWIATSSHVLCLVRDNLLRGVLTESDLREYSVDDGLRGIRGTRRDRSVVADAMGRIWFSLNDGISVVDPSRLARNSAPTSVRVQTISADNRPIDFRHAVRIANAPRRITFTYSAVSLWEPDRVRYRYRLDGYDSGWSEPAAGHEAAYTNLGPGEYRFRVVASNPEGVWNTQGTTIAFDVLPQFWQTWWFRVAGVLATGLIVLMLYRLKVHQLNERLNVRFEERLGERSRIARELHDTLLQSFQGSLFQIQAARNLFPKRPEDAMRTLDDAIGSAEAAITEGRDAIHNLRSVQGGHNDLAHLLTAAGQELSGAQDSSGNRATFRLTVEGPARTLSPMLQDEIYRIGREILRNAFHHARARKIEVEIHHDNRIFRLRIRDDGIGIDPKVLEAGARDGHWGLPGARERAQLAGAKLDLWSELGAGTEVQLTVPSSIAYSKSPNGSMWGLFRKLGRSRAE